MLHCIAYKPAVTVMASWHFGTKGSKANIYLNFYDKSLYFEMFDINN